MAENKEKKHKLEENSWEKLDYKELGLRCGIEIHQRLNTHKLFCQCPSILRDDKPDIIVKRKLRAVAGELGNIDIAAKHETQKDIYFVYEAYSDTTCLVELDEEPPHLMNQEALNTVLQVSLMLKAKPVDEVQIMRKTVINGSNTSGFQRTALVATHGTLDTKEGKVKIPTICVEEEAAKDVTKGVDKDGKRFVTYRLDRLGIPLIEMATDPDIFSPQQCMEAAAKLGMILRSTGKVARGIGTIRQDVNVSIAKGDRIEIKGAQDLKLIPTWVEYEARRQISILKLQNFLNNNKLKEQDFEKSITNLTNVFKNTNCKFVNNAIKKGDQVIGFVLPKMNKMLGNEICPNKRLGTELSDYIKVKVGLGGLIHSDEKLDKYQFSEEEINSTKKELSLNENDAFILIVAKEKIAKKGINLIIEKLMQFKNIGIVREVRKPNPDGTTSFMRPMPGGSRMYPETDTMPLKTDITNIKLPELLEEKAKRYEKEFKLGSDLATALAKSTQHDLFEACAKKFKNIKPAFIAETIVSTPKIISRKHKLNTDSLKDDQFKVLFEKLDSGNIAKDSVEDILISMAKNETIDFDKFKPMSDKDIEEEIKNIIKNNK
ncbi:Glu-tRNA(Gln) amidotransferase subunit GatE, partial [Candidatus Woesearchaeota archaeon]|nr:Glu-tRNA(Gln) amidotransferase subunit GatE [Candidatus Woesearchaeota archaeon]